MNDLFLKALACEAVPRPPVWLMRQAGRYMPQYRAIREKHSLWEMFHRPDIAAAVTKLPLELLGVDAAILFSDILVIVEALGLSVQFPETGGPRVESFSSLNYIPVEKSLSYVFETIRHVKREIDVPLIGFCGGPFTVASYMIDSINHAAFEQTKKWVREKPSSLHQLLGVLTEATIAYLRAQVEAGVDVVQVFDSWANVLGDEEFEVFSLPYLKQIVESMSVPVIVFCRSSSLRAERLAKIQPAGISFDWHLPMDELRQKVPQTIAVQGNFNPELLKFPKKQIVDQVEKVLTSMQNKRGYIVNLGHGVTPDIPVENVQCFVDTVKKYYL
jgi:uroporphyrinogen decarboxylase